MKRRQLPSMSIDSLGARVAARAAEKLMHAQVDAAARAATTPATMADWDEFEERNRALPYDKQVD